jgi:hypothetical protein
LLIRNWIRNHVYYEGYFHVLTNEKVFNSIHPRFGKDYDKPRAPEEYLRFFQVFKEKNSKWFDQLGSSFRKLEGRLGNLLADLIVQKRIFSDLSVQIHYGDEISNENLAWHRDALNSFLHMALSIKSNRALHLRSYLPNL